jgi:hypothetical protein
MPSFLKRALPDWLLIMVVSHAAATFFLLSIGFG